MIYWLISSHVSFLSAMHDDQDIRPSLLQHSARKNAIAFVSKSKTVRSKAHIKSVCCFLCKFQLKDFQGWLARKFRGSSPSAHIVALCNLFFFCCTRETKEFNGGRGGGVEWDIMWDSQAATLADRSIHNPDSSEHMNSFAATSRIARHRAQATG